MRIEVKQIRSRRRGLSPHLFLGDRPRFWSFRHVAEQRDRMQRHLGETNHVQADPVIHHSLGRQAEHVLVDCKVASAGGDDDHAHPRA
jgi:hypothetical protein